MKKNLLDSNAAQSLILRIQKLTPDTAALWGEMNATEMLLHCNSCNRQILTVQRGSDRTTMKQFLLRLLALYIAPTFKKGLKSEHRHITKGKIVDAEFKT